MSGQLKLCALKIYAHWKKKERGHISFHFEFVYSLETEDHRSALGWPSSDFNDLTHDFSSRLPPPLSPRGGVGGGSIDQKKPSHQLPSSSLWPTLDGPSFDAMQLQGVMPPRTSARRALCARSAQAAEAAAAAVAGHAPPQASIESQEAAAPLPPKSPREMLMLSAAAAASGRFPRETRGVRTSARGAAKMNKMAPPPPAFAPMMRRSFKKQQLPKVTVVTSNVQATPSNLGKDLQRLFVKKCTEAYCSDNDPMHMRLRGGGGHAHDHSADSSGSSEESEDANTLAAFAMRLKAPFRELPPSKADKYQVGLIDIADTLRGDNKDRVTVPV